MRTVKTDQTGRMPRLIGVFAGRTVTLLVLSCRGLFILFTIIHKHNSVQYKYVIGSERRLTACVHFMQKFIWAGSTENDITYVNNKGTDQPAHSHSLICAFVLCCLDSTVTSIYQVLLAKSKRSRLCSLWSWAGRFEFYLVARLRRQVFLVMWLIK